MAADNKTLGHFQLTNIPPAPRGVPQIEVSFDIDANGIVNVKAKDLGTNKEQAITITASSNLSEEEIDKMMKEAEANKEADAKRKEEAEIRNDAEQMVFGAEKALKDFGDKVKDDEKTSKIPMEEIEKDDTDEIKSSSEELSKVVMELSSRVYQEQAKESQAKAENASNESSTDNDSKVKDAEFEEK